MRYLNAVMTSNVRDLAPGQGNIGLLLNAQGHMLAELETLALEDRLLLLGHAMVREQTATTLDKFIIMDDATLTDETAESGTLAIEGPAAPAIVRELTGVDLLALPLRGHVVAPVKVAGGEIPCRVIRHSLFGFPGAEFLVRRDALAALWPALAAAVHARGGAPIGYRALNALRLEAGIAWFGSDFDQRQIPHEAATRNDAHQLHQGLLHRTRDRGARAVARPREPAAYWDGSLTAPSRRSQRASCCPWSKAAALKLANVTSAAFSPLLGSRSGLATFAANRARRARFCSARDKRRGNYRTAACWLLCRDPMPVSFGTLLT